MHVETDKLSHIYMDMTFVFCSQQCKDRFIANPHLYIGKPGKPAPKQHGKKIIKRRVMKLEQSIPENVSKNFINALNAMMGIKQVSIEEDNIAIIYDLLEATAQQIENTLEESGKMMASGWGESLRRGICALP